jgi:hypothetical protein
MGSYTNGVSDQGVMATNLALRGGWISYDGSASGVYVSTNGRAGIGTATPTVQLDVAGSGKFSGDLTVNGTIYGTASNLYAGTWTCAQTSSEQICAKGALRLLTNFNTITSNPEKAYTNSSYITPAAGFYRFGGVFNYHNSGGGGTYYTTYLVTNGATAWGNIGEKAGQCVYSFTWSIELPLSAGVTNQLYIYASDYDSHVTSGDGTYTRWWMGRIK